MKWTSEELMKFLSSKDWTLRRSIQDRLTCRSSHFIGRSRFVRERSGWSYKEFGDLYHGKEIFQATRRYHFSIEGLLSVAVYFESKELFYRIDCTQFPEMGFAHTCGQDRYSGGLLIDKKSWALIWTVSGPKKNLTIQSNYE